jgi:hypothetical protein
MKLTPRTEEFPPQKTTARISPLWLFCILVLAAIPAFAAENPEGPETGAARQESGEGTLSEDDAKADAGKPKPFYKNIVPVPVIITEPAIGEGLGVGIGYFHPAKSPDAYQPKMIEHSSTVRDVSLARKPPPTITGAFGAVTNNGTWAAGVGHINSFRNDTIRYTGVAAYANIIADFYVLDRPFEFNLEGLLVYNDVKFRVAESNWFLGTSLSYLDASNEFRLDIPEPPGSRSLSDGFLASDFKDIGLTLRTMYETRDDTLMPSTGRLFELSVTRNDEAIGGDYNYTTLKMKLLSFHQLSEKWVLGLRGDYRQVGGSPPFFAVPWVTLRGIPAMRFQGNQVAVAEVEARYNFNQDWAMIGFYGRGWTDVNADLGKTEEDIKAWGFGGRYRLLKDQNAWVGLDYAVGPEDNVYYVQVGHAW